MKKRLLLALALFLATAGAWMDPAWLYRTPITVNNPGSALVDYRLAVDSTNLIYNNTGLVGSWHFSEGNGTRAADSSGLGNDGTLTNGPVWVAGKFGNGLQFNGVNGYVRSPDSGRLPLGNSPRTIMAWINPSSYPDSTYNGIVAYGAIACGQGSMLSVKNDGRLSMAFWCNDAYQTAGPVVPLNNWTQVAFTYDGGTGVSFFINGQFVQAASVSSPANTQNGALRIGCTDDPGRCFNGSMDEVRIYNRVLSPQEIAALYNASKLRPDYGDLRFANSSDSSLPYWQESDSRAWVRVASIPAGASTVYAYYGNPIATSMSNKTAAFGLIEEFSGISLNPALWVPSSYSGSVSVGGGVAELRQYWTDNVWTRWARMDGLFNVTDNFDVAINISALGNYGEGNNYYAYVYAVKPDGSTIEVLQDQHGSGGTTWNYGSATPLITWLHGVQLPQYFTQGLLRISRVGSAWAASLGGNTQTWTDTSLPIRLRFYVVTYGAANGYMRLDSVSLSPQLAQSMGPEQLRGYKTLVRRCGLKQPGANVTTYSAGTQIASCLSDSNGICTLGVGAGTYDLQLRFADNSTAWKNGTVFS